MTDRMRVYYKSVFYIADNILQLIVSPKHYNGIKWDTGILRQTLSNSLNVTGILQNWIIEAILFSTICQYLCPIFLMFITENPTAIILNLKHYNASFRSNRNINLRVISIRFLNI